jgi:integrase
MPPVRLHDLRHGAASLALAAGADLKVVADQLGHCSIVLTADTYISVAVELALAKAEAVAQLILRAGRRQGTQARRQAVGRHPRRLTQPTATTPSRAAERGTRHFHLTI